MKIFKKALIMAAILPSLSIAAPNTLSNLPNEVKAALEKLYPNFNELQKSDALHHDGEFSLNSKFYLLSAYGSAVAISEDGKHVIAGNVIKMDDRSDYLEKALDSSRKRVISSIPDTDFIRYPSSISETKGVIHVFSDVTCHYCRVIHAEFEKLNAAGYEVRVVPFLRNAGVPNFQQSEVYLNTVAMMSLQDHQLRREAHDKLIAGETISRTQTNTIGEQAVEHGLNTGTMSGLQGTPHIVLDDGRAVSGAIAAEKLLTIINQ